MVFEEAARLSHQYGQRWTRAFFVNKNCTYRLSLLKSRHTPKFSHSGAQTHRLPDQSMQFFEEKMQSVHLLLPTIERGELLPVRCLKELAHFITAFECEDYSLEIRCRVLKRNVFYFLESGIKFYNSV